MANVASKGTFATYNGASLNDIFYEPVFRSDEIMRNYRVIPNVKHKMNVYTSAALTKIVRTKEGCNDAEAGTFNVDDKVLTAGRCRVALSQCSDEFYGTYIEEMYKNGVDVNNIEGTQLADAIVNRAVSGIASDVVRLAWGDDSALTGGSAVAGYGVFDGWMKLMAGETVIDYETANHAAPIAADAIGIIRKIYDQAPAALQQVPAGDKKFFVTPKVFNAYLANLEGSSADLAIVNTVDGMRKVMFRGVEIVPMYEWDTILADTNPDLFVDSATNYTNGICYCAVENLIIGSDVTDPEGSFKVFYDDLEEKMFFRGYFKLGVQYLYSSLVQWGLLIDEA